MKLAYHGATTMTSDLVTDVKAAAAAGFSGVEIWFRKLDAYLEDHSVDDLKALFVDNAIAPAALSSIEFIAFRGDEYQWVKDRCKQLAEIAEYISCPAIALVASPTPKSHPDLYYPWEDTADEYVSVLEELDDIARPHGVRLGFEFLGFSWCSVRTPKGAMEIVDRVNRENVGIILDTCHFYGGGGELREIEALDPAKIFTVHINDMEDVPKEGMTDGKRLMPGDPNGAIPLNAIFQRLKDIGFDGPVAVELFREEYWSQDPYDVTQRAYDTSMKALAPYFDVSQL
jgi:2-keto-myo-inositol isomerase